VSVVPALGYLALGDSYTIGEGVPAADRWPEQWCRALRRTGTAIEAPRFIARTGWTSDELSAAMDAEEPLGQWDLATLLIGVNDQYRGRPVAQFRENFIPLLARTLALVGGRPDRVLVLSIPDWGVTPFARASGRDVRQIADDLDDYNAATRHACAAQGVTWLDITGLTRDAGMRAEMLADDGLHPSGKMYAAWVEKILDELP
jgi:lysophospholipase L1-like esterase